jgi:hypothetical protein
MTFKDSAIYQTLRRHSDTLMLALLLVLFGGGAALALSWLGVNRARWTTDFSESSVPVDDIVSGGMGKDEIVPIDTPYFHTVDEARVWLDARSPVIALTIDDKTRAYPLEILLRHEVVNDRINDTYFAVTFCPLCNSAIVYNREVNGQILRLGVTGNLYNSGFLMWDNQTESWWQQFTGKAIVGEMTGEQLTMIPAQVVGFGTFADRFPQGRILAGDESRPRLNYGSNPYVGYDTSRSPLLNNSSIDTRLSPTQRVLAADINGMPVAYAFDYLQREQVINDAVGNTPVVVFWQPGATSALDAPRVAQSRDVGQAALYGRTVDGQQLSFRLNDSDEFIDEQTGSTWNIFGEATAGDLAGEQLPSYLCFPHFWFAWSSAHPRTILKTDDSS